MLGTPNRFPSPKGWTRAEFHFLADGGMLRIAQCELVLGEIIEKAQSRPHSYVVMRLTEWMLAVFGSGHVQCQMPIDVSPDDNPTSEPEPDVTALSEPMSPSAQSLPQPASIQLLVEVADSTLAYDKTTKARLYARAGIADYWVVDLPNRRVWVHRQPVLDGYSIVTEYGESASLSPLAAPKAIVYVRDFLGAIVLDSPR